MIGTPLPDDGGLGPIRACRRAVDQVVSLSRIAPAIISAAEAGAPRAGAVSHRIRAPGPEYAFPR
jgi:hypothetical protein